jgi:hypothetical protein
MLARVRLDLQLQPNDGGILLFRSVIALRELEDETSVGRGNPW